MNAMGNSRSQPRRKVKAAARKGSAAPKKAPTNSLAPELEMRINALLARAPELTREVEEQKLRIEKLKRESEEVIRRSEETRARLQEITARLLRYAAS